MKSSLNKILNEEFRYRLEHEFKVMYGEDITTKWDILSGEIVSTKNNGDGFSPEQHIFLRAFESGYLSAMKVVNRETKGE